MSQKPAASSSGTKWECCEIARAIARMEEQIGPHSVEHTACCDVTIMPEHSSISEGIGRQEPFTMHYHVAYYRKFDGTCDNHFVVTQCFCIETAIAPRTSHYITAGAQRDIARTLVADASLGIIHASIPKPTDAWAAKLEDNIRHPLILICRNNEDDTRPKMVVEALAIAMRPYCCDHP